MKQKIISLLMIWLIIALPIQAQETLEITDINLTHGQTTTITWTTNEPADSIIEYGTTTQLEQNITNTELKAQHTMNLQTTPGLKYYYRIKSCGMTCKSTNIESFVAGPLYVDATIPKYPKTTKINIPGTTRDGATVTITVNGINVRKDTTTDTFLFKDVQLQKGPNIIIIKTELNGETTEKRYDIEVDDQPPIINVTAPTISTKSSAEINITTSETINLTIQNKTREVKNTATIKVDLIEGENLIDVLATDKAGQTAYTQERIIYDTGPPKIIQTNIKQISPSYSREITIKGNISEQASITVFVNDKAQKTEPTNPDGTFAIKAKLERPIQETTTQTTISTDTGISWKNKVKIEAIDAAGLKTQEEAEITYNLCGEGTWITVTPTEPMPAMLTPRMLIEGIQQIGMSYEYKYHGGYTATINPRDIKIKKVILSPEYEKNFDNGLINIYSPVAKAARGTTPQGKGYLQLNFNPITDPWQLVDKQEHEAPTNATMYDKEKRISEHREGECLTPGFGCMKLWLEVEIPFQEQTEQTTIEGKTEKQIINRVQKTCLNVEVTIDKRIPPKYIPKTFLQITSNYLTRAIELIDLILKPIETMGQYIFYTCVAGNFLAYVPIYLEKYNCEYTSYATVATGEGYFDKKIAEIGACEAEYKGDDEKQKKSKENCLSCQKWKNYRQRFDRLYRQVCDRVYCPAAPTLQNYLKQKANQKPTPITTKQAHTEMAAYKVDGKLFSGSDCAAFMLNKPKPTAKTPASQYFSSTDIQTIYNNWIKHKDDTAGEGETGAINCAGLHPATPECCGYEYMQEWSSACGVSMLGNGLDTFDEIKESTCLSAQKIGKNQISAGETTTQCNSLFNSASGFCTSSGQPTPEIIRVIRFRGDSGKTATGKIAELGIGTNKEQYMYLLMTPTQAQWDIKLAYIVQTIELTSTNKTKTTINDKTQAVDLPGTSEIKEKYFSEENKNKYYEGKLDQKKYSEFQTYLCDKAGYPNANCGVNGKSIYDQVMAKIGQPEQEYIIKPGDGLFTSIRCMCFPTLISYLKMAKNIMSAVRDCTNTILLTGDGNEGVCTAVITQYACDLLYDAIACFTQKFSGSSMGRIDFTGGNIIGALTAAGSELSRTADQRYGESNMYKTLFVEKKLVHSVCMFAFTGTWNLDLAATFDQSVDEIPIGSQALLYPCNRRFVSPNPTTTPSGLATWAYHFGIGFIAGSTSDLELHLVCSGGYKCSEENGYENGKCDCETEKDIVIAPRQIPTKVNKGQLVNEEIYYTIQGSPGEGRIRYDKAYLLYRYKDGNKLVEKKTDACTISQTGGPGAVPNFCRFDALTNSFRCNYADQPGAIHIQTNQVYYPTNQSIYFLNNLLNITLNIQQDHRGKTEDDKHLEYNITNIQGNTVTTNNGKELIRLTTNGDYMKTIGQMPPIQITNDWFKTTQPAQTQIKQWYTQQSNIATPNTIIDSIKYTAQGIDSTKPNRFVLQIIDTNKQVSYAVYYAEKDTLNTQTGFGKLGAPICTGLLAGDTISCNEKDHILNIRLKTTRPELNQRYESYIDLNSQQKITDPCTTKQPQTFRMKIKIFDSDKYGQPTDQLTIDPLTSNELTYEIPFNAVCANQQEIIDMTGFKPISRPAAEVDTTGFKPISKPTTPTSTTPDVQIEQMTTLLVQKIIHNINTEQKLITYLNNTLNELDKLPLVYETIPDDKLSTINLALDLMITEQTEYKKQLEENQAKLTQFQNEFKDLIPSITALINQLQTAKTKINEQNKISELLAQKINLEKTINQIIPLERAILKKAATSTTTSTTPISTTQTNAQMFLSQFELNKMTEEQKK